jgi:hypothetical protein
MSPLIFLISSLPSSLYTLYSFVSGTITNSIGFNTNGFSADFFICFKNASYTEAVFATLSALSTKLAIKKKYSPSVNFPALFHSSIFCLIASILAAFSSLKYCLSCSEPFVPAIE